jgi:hypothetical protein
MSVALFYGSILVLTMYDSCLCIICVNGMRIGINSQRIPCKNTHIINGKFSTLSLRIFSFFLQVSESGFRLSTSRSVSAVVWSNARDVTSSQ